MSAVNAEYFAKLQKALKRAGLAEPVLVVDRQRLDANIRQLCLTPATSQCKLNSICLFENSYPQIQLMILETLNRFCYPFQ